MSCVCRMNITGNRININLYDTADFMMRNFNWLNEISDQLNISEEENQQISESITEYLYDN